LRDDLMSHPWGMISQFGKVQKVVPF